MTMQANRQHGPKPRADLISVSFRLPSQLKHDLEEMARRDDRSLANFIEHLLKATVADREAKDDWKGKPPGASR